MLKLRSLIGGVAVLALLVFPTVVVRAQGVTTGALVGTITDNTGAPVEAAQVQVRNASTGYNIGAVTRSTGTYIIQGIEPNQNYRITIRRIGYAPTTRDGITISLGQARREDFKLVREVAMLGEVSVTASATDAVINASKTGTSTSISDSALRRLPTINRNFVDFVQLVPQVSTTTGFLSGGGVNLRQNSIQIDGAQSSDLFGLGTTGQPGASAGAKSIPLDAVKEYQVLLSPFDVRQGSFGGLLINAVTKSGTNDWHGTVYGDSRSQSLTRSQPYLNAYKSQHVSASLGGPIVKDKLFLFASGELQKLDQPAGGSYLGAPDQYVTQSTIDAVNAAAARYGLADGGTGEQIFKKNPNRNAFVRMDAYLPLSTRLVLRHNYASADNSVFGRGLATAATPNFNLTSNRYDLSNTSRSSVAELLTNMSSGIYNEFLANYSTIKDFRTVPQKFPQLTVRGIARSDDATRTTNFVLGTENSSQANSLDQRTMEFTDNLTIPLSSHAITIGGKALYYKSINLFAQNSFGNWTFASLDALNSGVATQYIISAPAPTDPYNGLATIKAATYSGYIEDAWQATPTLSLTFGVRMDKPVFDNVPPLNPEVLADYNRETSSVPHTAQYSPRFGFNWDVTGDQKNQLRGGVGSFSGPTPFVYLSNAFGNSGLSGYSSITCNGATLTNTSGTSTGVPAFNAANASNPPLQCLDGTRPNGTIAPGAAISGPAAGAAVNTIDPNFKNPKYLKATGGYDHRFANGIVGTIEGLYSRSQNNAFYRNLALPANPVGQDIHGRQLYGILTPTGATPATSGPRTAVLDVTNASGDYTWSATAQVQKSFTDNFDGSLAYTHQVSRDVVSVTSSTAGSNFRYQRDVSGRLDDLSLGKSKYDQPHRIIATGSYRFPTFTDVSVIYTGNSGAPYDYTYGSSGGTTGDLNGDGQSQNDLIYVPRNALDQSEILFAGYNGNTAARTTAATQAQAFENFINTTPCLGEARGTILTRNACRNPWVNEFDLSVAQSLGKLGGRAFENLQVRLDIVNLGNLLNKDWGKQAFSDQGNTCGQICSATIALVHMGNALPSGVTTNSPLAQGIYTFNTGYQAYNADNASSNYRMQLSMRYSF
ncbi:MAG: TonB-dependent receptor [Polaromonas sp.]|nr:TonB-dependent receptor [Gemmatimonadaceae bacterium]